MLSSPAASGEALDYNAVRTINDTPSSDAVVAQVQRDTNAAPSYEVRTGTAPLWRHASGQEEYAVPRVLAS